MALLIPRPVAALSLSPLLPLPPVVLGSVSELAFLLLLVQLKVPWT